MPTHRVLKAWKTPEPYTFDKDGKTITLQSHILDLDNGQKITVNKKPEFLGFDEGAEYEFEISDEKSKSGKTFKAKHVTVRPVTCPSCKHEFIPTYGQTAGAEKTSPQGGAGTEQHQPSPPTPAPEPTPEDFNDIPF